MPLTSFQSPRDLVIKLWYLTGIIEALPQCSTSMAPSNHSKRGTDSMSLRASKFTRRQPYSNLITIAHYNNQQRDRERRTSPTEFGNFPLAAESRFPTLTPRHRHATLDAWTADAPRPLPPHRFEAYHDDSIKAINFHDDL